MGTESTDVIHHGSVSKTFLLADPFLYRKITTGPHITAHVNSVSGDTHPKLKIYIANLILDKY
jgi:hypothetical protein